MKTFGSLLALIVAFIATITIAYHYSGNGGTQPSPVHVTAVFFDGVNHGDYRQTCSVWEAARKNMARCEAGMTVQIASSVMYGEFGGYQIVAHSEKEWRTGAIEYATVQVKYVPTGGQKVVAHLRKRPGGAWEVWWVG